MNFFLNTSPQKSDIIVTSTIRNGQGALVISRVDNLEGVNQFVTLP